jgi:glycosyltransferase involved in cell wall biosynthesis
VRLGILIGMVGRKAGGLESYERGLVSALIELDSDNQYELFCLSSESVSSLCSRVATVRCRALWPGNRWISLPLTLPFAVRGRADLLHATFVRPPFCPVPTVFTVHDLGMFTNPEFYHPVLRLRMNHLIRSGIGNSRVVICVSNTIRELVRDKFRVPDERLTTVYHGISSRFRPLPPDQSERVRSKYDLHRPYLLFVGQLREGIKNLSRLVKAFHLYRASGNPEMQLVLAGRRPYQARYPSGGLDATIQRLEMAPHVRELGYVDDDDLPALYGQAEMLVFPSLCEGFGFPVLEAMACCTPVLASKIDTLVEIAGGAALTVDPSSIEEIADGMSRLTTDSSLRAELRAKGLTRVAAFSWQKSARETLAAYCSALEVGDPQTRASVAAAD